MIGLRHRRGFSLLELLLVLALVGALLCLGSWGSAAWVRRWQVTRGVGQLYEDLKQAQTTAEQAGNTALVDGALVARRSFLVFNPEQTRYSLYQWQDVDGDGVPQPGENRRIWERQLPPGVEFAVAEGIGLRACSNQPGAPSGPITFNTAGYPPCLGQPCIKFDNQGFSVMGPGAAYLTNGDRHVALTLTRPGHFTLCRWDGSRWL